LWPTSKGKSSKKSPPRFLFKQLSPASPFRADTDTIKHLPP
jgi:hypothetical protein